jgi:signal transduction histidine kinase
MAPRSTTMTTDSVWPLRAASGEAAGMIVEHLDDRFRGVLVGARRVPPQRALVAPLYETGDDRVLGLIVLGLNPRLRLDDAYREFLRLAVRGTADRVADAHGRERERERLDRMADLDREKTEFFSNVSHEFRTPLTLMLAPLQELRRRAGELPAGADAELELIERNARRLLRLVGTLLDFSRIEAGRAEASFEPTDLAERTRDIVSVFRSAAERAGLVLRVDVEPLAEPVWVDRQMWEKIVSNLVSNALKFTFAGEITVALRARPKHAELVVRDTGVGIPAEELPHLFKRFHRVRGARARTHEGAGIGLALVHELVRAHHGRVRVTSAEGEGTAFTVWLPLGRRAGVQPGGSSAGEGAVAAALAEEASRCDSDRARVASTDLEDPSSGPLAPRAAHARVLVADDNADMREYLTRCSPTPGTSRPPSTASTQWPAPGHVRPI